MYAYNLLVSVSVYFCVFIILCVLSPFLSLFYDIVEVFLINLQFYEWIFEGK